MEDTTLEYYRSMIGKEVEYFLSRGFSAAFNGLRSPRKLHGTILEITYNDEMQKLCAVIQRITRDYPDGVILTKCKPPVDIVPVENIIVNVEPSSSSFLEDKSSPLESHGQDSSTKQTAATVVDEIKVGDQIVWLRQSVTGSPLIGTITGIGGSFQEHGDVIAVVQFDQPTGTLPRYLKHAPANRNLVNVSELVPLADWLEDSMLY